MPQPVGDHRDAPADAVRAALACAVRLVSRRHVDLLRVAANGCRR